MKRTFLLYVLLIASIPVLLAQPAEFDFTPNNTSGGIIATVTVNEVPASDADYVAAFDEAGNCAGAVKLVNYYSQAFCNLQVYGDDITTDGIDEGINAGETFTFKLWISATDEILDHPMDMDPVSGWDAGLNGTPVPGYDFPDGVNIDFMRDVEPILGCTDDTACNYDATATEDDGSCTFPASSDVDCDGNCLVTVDCAGVCGGDAIAGTVCTDSNGNESVYSDECSCPDAVIVIPGCTDDTACNYDATATEDNGSCTFPASSDVDCDGNCLVTVDCNGDCGGTATEDCEGVCGGTSNAGAECTDASGNAGTYDGSCNCVSNPIPGCTDDTACNYDATATEDNGSCTFPASSDVDCDGNCLVTVDCNGDCGGTATEDCEGVCGGTSNAGAECTDASGNAGTYDGSCNCVSNPIPGCTDDTACNYDETATEDNGSCVFVEAATITGGPFTFCVGDGESDFVSDITLDGGSGSNTSWVITDDQLNILGLPPMPGVVDFESVGAGTCLIWYLTFENVTGANIGDNAADLDGCFALSNSIEVIRELAGCTDPAASNYNADAQCDDGSCMTTVDCTPPSAGDFDCE